MTSGTIGHLEAHPYPDGHRVEACVHLSSLQADTIVELTLSIYSAAGDLAARMYVVDVREGELRLTLHPRPPIPGPYRLEAHLRAGNQILDHAIYPFTLPTTDRTEET